MTPLSKKARSVFDALLAGKKQIGEYSRFDHSPGFMPTVVQVVGRQGKGLLVSVSHTYTQNGDLMRDPEVVFLVGDKGDVWPLTYQQDGLGVYREWVRFEGERVLYNERGQKDLAHFCNDWLSNIKEQQGIGQ